MAQLWSLGQEPHIVKDKDVKCKRLPRYREEDLVREVKAIVEDAGDVQKKTQGDRPLRPP